MKKRVLFLMMAALAMPFAMKAQQNAYVHVESTASACDTFTWSVTGLTYDSTGIYTHIAADTFYFLDLTINPTYTVTVPDIIEGGCTYSWGDSVYTTVGTKTQTFTTAAGCDSTVTINLALSGQASKEYTWVACEELIWKGDTLTTSGTYNVTDTSNSQCDSLLTLNLTINAPTQIAYDTTVVACQRSRFRFSPTQSWTTVTTDGYEMCSEPWASSTAANRAIFHPRTAQRCFDSVVTVHFNIKKLGYNKIKVSACDTYTFVVNDTIEKTYTFSVSNDSVILSKEAANGCDSVIKFNVTIHKSPQVAIDGKTRVRVGEQTTLYGSSNQSVKYLWSNGATTDSITLTVNDNIDVSLTATNNSTGCSTSAYVTVMATTLGIEEGGEQLLTIYPNPTSARININSEERVQNVSIFNMTGQQVMNAQNATDVDLSSLANGNYVVRVALEGGNVVTRTIVLSK